MLKSPIEVLLVTQVKVLNDLPAMLFAKHFKQAAYIFLVLHLELLTRSWLLLTRRLHLRFNFLNLNLLAFLKRLNDH